VLKAIREQAAELVEKCHIPLAASVVAGLCQQAESGLIDLGLVNPEGSEEGASLLVGCANGRPGGAGNEGLSTANAGDASAFFKRRGG